MKTSIKLALLAAVAALAAPACASAHADAQFIFTGVAGSSAAGSIESYAGPSYYTSFAGDPVTISLSVAQPSTAPYVDAFSIKWSNASYPVPYVRSFSGSGMPYSDAVDWLDTFFSTISLDHTGGSISIRPSDGWSADTDGAFNFNIDFTHGGPHSPFTGSGSVLAGVNDYFDPRIGDYDADSNTPFTLTELSATAVPDASTWALMLVGVAGVGFAARARARRGASGA